MDKHAMQIPGVKEAVNKHAHAFLDIINGDAFRIEMLCADLKRKELQYGVPTKATRRSQRNKLLV